MVSQRVAEAESEAGQLVDDRSRQAREDAEAMVQEVRSREEDSAHEAQREAEDDQERAEKAMREAVHQLAEARRLADEAEQMAAEAAEDAHRQAKELTTEVEREAIDAEEQIAAAAEIRKGSRETTRDAGRRSRNGQAGGDLASLTKEELLDLAVGLDLPGRSSMTKSELVTAIKRRSKESTK